MNNDEPKGQATNVDPAVEQHSNALNEENWIVENLPNAEDVRVYGFLQLCADRRFHRDIQERFQRDAKLPSPLDYWIHADAGGAPMMLGLTTAPTYCYETKGVRL